ALVEHCEGGGSGSVDGCRDPFDEVRLDLLVDGREQLQLAVEVVVERATCDARGTDDLLRAHARVAALGEQAPRRVQQRRARGERALGLEARALQRGGSL